MGTKEDFLKELHDLCVKYNATISGCGCCNSPYGDVDGDTYYDLEVSTEILKYD